MLLATSKIPGNN